MQVGIWDKSPGLPHTPEEFAAKEPLWSAKVLKQQEALEREEAEKQQRNCEHRKWRNERERQDPAPPPASVAALSVGRNQPCTAPAGAAASSRSAAAADCYPRRTLAGQVAFRWFVSLVICVAFY